MPYIKNTTMNAKNTKKNFVEPRSQQKSHDSYSMIDDNPQARNGNKDDMTQRKALCKRDVSIKNLTPN